ncbi:complement C1q-like protein 2 [Coregonus clupeaformis]|uniref:complement C1q-like protein 2 n=1 Tax=Coregonus clupeaformis TaxID=59861 RepID=UPI001E1C6324|nr:complement C1q-like protein 2 [Coregonus clupeaformis]
MGGLTLTLVLLCLSGTLSEDAGEDNLNDIMVQIQPEQGRNIENEYKTHNQQVKTASTTTTTQSGCEPTIHTVMRELGAMEERLGATVRSLEGMRNRLEASESQVRSLNATVNELKRFNEDRPQVAFSATLGISGTIGPVSNEITLVFRRVLSNIGNAYNPTTGIFTAPVRGLYHFTFTAFDWGRSTMTGASLCHNGQRMVSVYDEKEGGSSESSSNSATFLLQVGEQVYVALWKDGRRISDNANHYSSFNGFLLFPM